MRPPPNMPRSSGNAQQPGVPGLPPGASSQTKARPGGPGEHQPPEGGQANTTRCRVSREAVSPGFRPGLLVKRSLGPEGRVSTSRRRSAKRKRHDVVFRVKQCPRASARGFLWCGAHRPLKAPGGSRGTPGVTTTQRATLIRERPTTPSPRASARGFLSCGAYRPLKATGGQERMPFTTFPCTSVSLKSRPW